MVEPIAAGASPALGHRPAGPLRDLDLLVARLQVTVLRADAEREKRLRTCEFERKRVATVSTCLTPHSIPGALRLSAAAASC